LNYFENLFTLTASLLIAVVRAVVVPVAHLHQRDTVFVVTSELSRGAGGCWCVAHVLQLIGLIPTVIVAVAHKVQRHAAAVLAGELVLLTRLVGAALLVAAVSAVVTTIAPDFRRVRKDALKLPDRHLMTDVIKDIQKR